jgi:SAM-dependent methyltransferase
VTDGVDPRLEPLLQPAAAERATLATEGWVELLDGEVEASGAVQRLMITRLVPTIYEQWWRPAWGRLLKGFTGPGMEEEIRIARLLLGLSAGHRILDVACGPANFTRSFARAVEPGGLAVGIDASETMLARGLADTRRAKLENVILVRGDATELPFRDAGFDAVCCFAALHLFADPFGALDDMARVLRPGGRIAIMTSIRRQLALPALKPVIERASGIRVFERGEVVGHLQERGFTDLHQRVSGVVQFVGGRLPAG